jgi:hypothetical protein
MTSGKFPVRLVYSDHAAGNPRARTRRTHRRIHCSRTGQATPNNRPLPNPEASEQDGRAAA